MTQLNLMVDIENFDLNYVDLNISVFDCSDEDEKKSSPGKKRNGSSSKLRMTLPEVHLFLLALKNSTDTIHVTTPNRT